MSLRSIAATVSGDGLGRHSRTMPGVNPLVAELEVNHKTVEAALRKIN